MTEPHTSVVQVYIDDQTEPMAVVDPPGEFVLDTERLADGPHVLRIEATDEAGYRSVRQIPFEVRNGPGIGVSGIRSGEVITHQRSIVVNAYAGGRVEEWQPRQAETPAPIPSWTWVLALVVIALAVFYVAREWQPPARFASTPTFAGWGGAGVAASQAAVPAGADRGADLFRVTCANCHQANGEGIPGAFPPLAHDPVVTATDPRQHAAIVLFGLSGRDINGAHYAGQMPAWGSQLSDVEIATIMNYERTAWGNAAPRTTPQFVQSVRAAHVMPGP